jgi:hypothetical protein
MGIAGLILGALIGMAVATVTASAIGELVVNALWLDVNYPYMVIAGGDCALVSNTAFAACIFSGFTFIVFIAAAVLYLVLKTDVAKFLAIVGVCLNIAVTVCSIILYAKVPGRGDDGLRKELFCDMGALTGDDWDNWNKVREKRLSKYKNAADDVYRERSEPYGAWLALMIVSLFAFVLVAVILVLALIKFEGIYDILPAHGRVSGDIDPSP